MKMTLKDHACLFAALSEYLVKLYPRLQYNEKYISLITDMHANIIAMIKNMDKVDEENTQFVFEEQDFKEVLLGIKRLNRKETRDLYLKVKEVLDICKQQTTDSIARYTERESPYLN